MLELDGLFILWYNINHIKRKGSKNMDNPEILYMVVPCYNEQEVLHETAKQLKEKYTSLIQQKLISTKSRIVFVNDGSKDSTWNIIQELHTANPEFFSGINFTPFSDGFIDSYVAQYFTDLEETAENTDYDSLSHLTVPLRYIVHKYKRKVDLGKYADSIDKILKTVIKRKKSLEVNTSGYTGKDPFFMPCETIIRRYTELGGVDFTIGSDAHIPEKMSCGLSEGAKMLLKLGVTHLNYYEKRQKISYSIKE